jgi:hypothetical protein
MSNKNNFQGAKDKSVLTPRALKKDIRLKMEDGKKQQTIQYNIKSISQSTQR